jgi:hypothetical protein
MKWCENCAGNGIKPAPRLILAMIFTLFLCALPLQAWSQVTASYVRIGGGEITLAIEVGASPPSSLIVVQNLPPGTGISNADPPVQKYNPGKGEAKWLLRSLQPGLTTISLSLDREVSPADVSGQVRFKSPREGGMETITVSRP